MTLKFLIRAFFVCTALFFIGWFGLRYAAHTYADYKAHEITFLIDKDLKSPDEKIKLITKRVSESFEHVDPSTVPALKFRSYVTNRRLPAFMRWKEGAIETIVNKGLCDNAARQLSYVLAREGFDSTQWNMMTPKGGHSALLVTLPDGRKVLTDPLFSLSAVNNKGELISPEEALDKIQSGHRLDVVFEALTDESNYKFYQAFEKVSMAPQGESLMINISIPSFKNELILGQLNNDSRDVKNEGNALNMGPYLHYVGHQYDPNWVRVLKVEKDMSVEFTLMQEPDETVMIFEPGPKVEGNKLKWTIKAGEEIRFYDSRAKLSLKRRNSYIGVDQVTFSSVK